MDMPALHNPDADAFHPARIDIPGILDSHGRIGGMKAAHMFVIQTLFATDKDLPKRPIMLFFHIVSFSAHAPAPPPAPRPHPHAPAPAPPAVPCCRGRCR